MDGVATGNQAECVGRIVVIVDVTASGTFPFVIVVRCTTIVFGCSSNNMYPDLTVVFAVTADVG